MSGANQLLQNSSPGTFYLDQYVEITTTLVANNSADTISLKLQFHKQGSLIMVRIIRVGTNTGNGAGVSNYNFVGVVPSQFRPSIVADMPVLSVQSGISTMSLLEIGSTGNIIVTPIGSSTFVATSSVLDSRGFYYLL